MEEPELLEILQVKDVAPTVLSSVVVVEHGHQSAASTSTGISPHPAPLFESQPVSNFDKRLPRFLCCGCVLLLLIVLLIVLLLRIAAGDTSDFAASPPPPP